MQQNKSLEIWRETSHNEYENIPHTNKKQPKQDNSNKKKLKQNTTQTKQSNSNKTQLNQNTTKKKHNINSNMPGTN